MVLTVLTSNASTLLIYKTDKGLPFCRAEYLCDGCLTFSCVDLALHVVTVMDLRHSKLHLI